MHRRAPHLPDGTEGALEWDHVDRIRRSIHSCAGGTVSVAKVDVEDGEVVAYRVDMKVTFLLT